IACAWLVRLRLVRSLLPLAPLMQRATQWLRWGAHRGGMFVEVEGSGRGGSNVRRSWHLLAEGDDGPLVPSMAAEAGIRTMAPGDLPTAGARAAADAVRLEDYESLFANRTICTGVRDESAAAPAPLYARVLGRAWHALPEPIRALHSVESTAWFA